MLLGPDVHKDSRQIRLCSRSAFLLYVSSVRFIAEIWQAACTSCMLLTLSSLCQKGKAKMVYNYLHAEFAEMLC